MNRHIIFAAMSRKIFVAAAGLAFLMTLVSMYFGSSIYNANENVHLGYLNEMDKIYYYDIEKVPQLTKMAAIISLVFLIPILGLESYTLIKSPVKSTRKIAIALATVAVILIFIAILTISNPVNFDFSKWGFAWVFGGLFTIAGNVLSVFLKTK
jgi:hypothetical protein